MRGCSTRTLLAIGSDPAMVAAERRPDSEEFRTSPGGPGSPGNVPKGTQALPGMYEIFALQGGPSCTGSGVDHPVPVHQSGQYVL